MATVQTTLRANKKVLRKAIEARLRDLPLSALQEQSQAITAHIMSSPFFLRCKSVSCYLSMPNGEVDTSVLVSEILRAGKTLYVPRIDCTTPSHMELLQIEDLDDLRSLPSGTWGIKEPGPEWIGGRRRPNVLDESCEGLELILVPGVAFDRSLSRLGHGKGYYDRFISSYTALRPQPLLVALALRQQIIDGEVPIGAHDWKMDMVVGPDGIIGADMLPDPAAASTH